MNLEKIKLLALLTALLCVGTTCKVISDSKNIKINTFTSSDHIFVELTQLEYFPKQKKIDFIKYMIQKYPNDFMVFKSNDKEVDISRLVKFSIMKDQEHTFAKSIIPVKIEALKSFDGFYFDL